MTRLIHTALFLVLFPFLGKSQIVINEIFADPTPSVGLPEEEFLELYNLSNNAVSLQDWKISDANTEKTIEADFILAPNAYVILCADEHEGIFEVFGDVVTVSSLPSLNNGGDEILLFNPENELIDFVAYESTWYNDIIKDDGGWTLERINPENICDAAPNWSASNDLQGGSPGESNSIFDPNFQDNSQIEVQSVSLNESELLEIAFSKPPNNNMVQTDAFAFSPTLTILDLQLNANTVVIEFVESLIENQIYELNINNLQDCQGTSSVSGDFIFGIPQSPQNGEILINEILFNPTSGGVDFIELVNVSQQLFAFDNLSILELDVFNDAVIDYETLSDVKQYILPNEYYVLTSDTAAISAQYTVTKPENLIEINIPNYPDEEGKLAILNQTLDTIDLLHYSDEWHYELLNRLDGVSLERLSLEQATQDKNNWFSASYIVGNASPTAENSQNINSLSETSSNLILSDKIFTPDGDGNNDFLTIDFHESEIGSFASVEIYDSRGFLINTLVNNQLIGNHNQFRWTGVNNENKPVAIGHYFVIAELYNENGDRTILKEKVVLSRVN